MDRTINYYPTPEDQATGRSIEELPPLSPQEYANVIFRAVRRTKPYLSDMRGFHTLESRGDEYILRTELVRTQAARTFGLSTPVRLICTLQNEQIGIWYRFYLTRTGAWRIITQTEQWEARFRPASRLVTATRVFKPSGLIPFLEMDQMDLLCPESHSGSHHPGFCLLEGVLALQKSYIKDREAELIAPKTALSEIEYSLNVARSGEANRP